MKEKLGRCCRYEYGWNYAKGYNYNKVKRNGEISELFELLGLVGATIGSTCFTGTLFLCLFSIFVHLQS
ncbi:hypothetical protein ES288_D07G088200v1 [Gossypium darwinii]|nr:hypothetical protein ES288_D07G088100v1 [Gossypium darwinii]TYG60702.1 hypothetical protein ES288_D07G088200v1 [Gossypium darwinii]